MIIPIKCFTCGNVLADKYLYYLKEVRKIRYKTKLDDTVVYLTSQNVNDLPETPEYTVLKQLQINN